MEMGWLEKRLLQTSAWGWLSRRILIPWVFRFARPPEDAEVLELGCGSGSEAVALLERFPRWHLTATDYDPEMVALATDRLAPCGSSVRVQAADATALPFGDSSFDLVVAVLVWHHVGDWRRATAEAHRVLRPGGWLILADLLAPFFAGVTRRLFAPARTYTFDELRAAVATVGFRLWRTSVTPFWYRAVAQSEKPSPAHDPHHKQ